MFKDYETHFKNYSDDELKPVIKEFETIEQGLPKYEYKSIDLIINYLLNKEEDYIRTLNLLGFKDEEDYIGFKEKLKKRLRNGV